MDTDTPKDFFISYTHADQRWAAWIAWHLEAEGYHTMLQAWDFLAGSNFVLAMDTAARQATHTIAVLSPDYFTSKFTPSEWAAAFRRDPTSEQGRLLPVRVRPCDVEGLLGQIVYIDLVDQDEATARATLLQGIKHERRKPGTPPAFPSLIHTPHSSAHPTFPGALPAVWNIPYPRNPYFTGREELLHRLAASLRAGETVGISQPQAVSGLGGVGKTQLALEYAYRYYQDYEAVLWTRADTQEALISGFVAFAALLQLPQQEERDQLKIVQAVKHWLTSHTRWLLILDNADDLTLLQDFLPPAGRGHTLLTTRAASDQVQERSALAADLLRVCAFLHPDAIPEEIITEGAAALGPELQVVAQRPLAFNQAIGVLLAYSLLKRQPEEHLLSMHRLVQAVLKDGMDASTSHDWVERVVQAVNTALPADVEYRTYTRYERCLPHAQECARLIEQVQLTTFAARRLLNQMGIYLKEHARYAEAEAFHRNSLRIREQVQGPDHPEVAYPLYNLANLYYEQGKYAEAEPLYQRALHIWEQELVSDHPQVAYPLNGLAALYSEQGKYAEAEPLYQRALRIWEQAYGPDHPLVANPLNNLALLYADQGKHEEAEPLYQRAIAIHEKMLGPEHPGLAPDLNNLALLYADQGKYDDAEPLYQRAMHIWEQALGSDHPDVAYPLNGLANLYNKQGKDAEAEPLYQRALHIREQALGPDHPLTREVVRNYAMLLREMGRESDASKLEARFPSS